MPAKPLTIHLSDYGTTDDGDAIGWSWSIERGSRVLAMQAGMSETKDDCRADVLRLIADLNLGANVDHGFTFVTEYYGDDVAARTLRGEVSA